MEDNLWACKTDFLVNLNKLHNKTTNFTDFCLVLFTLENLNFVTISDKERKSAKEEETWKFFI